MKFENENVNTSQLNKATFKLLKYGEEVFDLYCDEINMSYCDRNRVIAKAKLQAPNRGFKERPLPRNLKGERWEYYTKVMGYTEARARQLLKEIDAALTREDQFIADPKIAERIAKDVSDEIPF